MNSEIPVTSAARRLTAYSFLVVFANDRTIDEGELRMLERISMEDGVIDDEEKRVLSMLFGRVSKETVAEAVWAEIGRFRDEHGIE